MAGRVVAARVGALALAVGVGVAGCAAPPPPRPPYATVGGFTTGQGVQGLVVQTPGVAGYQVVYPGTPMGPQRVLALDAFSGVRLVGQAAVQNGAQGETVLLLEGSEPGCALKSVIVAVRGADLRSMPVPGCGVAYAVSAPGNGRSALLRGGAGRGLRQYTYRDGRVSAVIARAVVRRPVGPVPDVDDLPPAAAPLDLDK